MAVRTSGGAHSELFVLYALTIAFAATYRLREQVGLFVLTAVLYPIAIEAWDAPALSGALVVRGAAGAILGLLVGLLSFELKRAIDMSESARKAAERSASVLGTVTWGVGHLSLDADEVLGGTLDTVNALGFPVACLYVLEEDGRRAGSGSRSHKILELHSSELEVRSAPGEGARFSFRLQPLTPDAAPAESEEVCEVVR